MAVSRCVFGNGSIFGLLEAFAEAYFLVAGRLETRKDPKLYAGSASKDLRRLDPPIRIKRVLPRGRAYQR